jgi:sigma-E factor negative regulatory protein RseA
MSQQFEEQLSAFMDGELGRDETRFVLRRAESDSRLAARWSRYHVARQALRRQEIVAIRVDFASSIMAQLEAESAPQSARTPWLRWGSGGAIAAAVAVAALMVTRPAEQPSPTPIAAATNPARAPQVATITAPSASNNAVAAANPAFQAPLVPNSPIQTTAAALSTDVTEPVGFDPRMQSYVIRHYQATGSTGQPDFVPYILLPVEPRKAEAPQNH